MPTNKKVLKKVKYTYKGVEYTFFVDEDDWLEGGPEAVNDAWLDYQKQKLGLTMELTSEHYKAIGRLWLWAKKVDGQVYQRTLQKNTGFSIKRVHQLFSGGSHNGLGKMANIKFIGSV
jgi:hypothetical protein